MRPDSNQTNMNTTTRDMLLYLQQLRAQVAEAEQHSAYVSDSEDDEVHEERWEAIHRPMVIAGPMHNRSAVTPVLYMMHGVSTGCRELHTYPLKVVERSVSYTNGDTYTVRTKKM